MRAIRVHETGGPEVLRAEEVDPPSPGPGELLIDVEATGVNFIEIYFREGLYPTQRPYTPGSEAAGTVRALGDGVTDFAVGDRVVSQSVKGAYAEQATVPADKAVKIPDAPRRRRPPPACFKGSPPTISPRRRFRSRRATVHSCTRRPAVSASSSVRSRSDAVHSSSEPRRRPRNASSPTTPAR